MSSPIDQIVSALEDAASVLGDQRIHKGEFTRHGYSVKERVVAALAVAKEMRDSVPETAEEPSPEPVSEA